MRYQFYREHKYVSSALNDLERMIAKTDFRDAQELILVRQAFQSLSEMLRGHAQYENERLHALLKKSIQRFMNTSKKIMLIRMSSFFKSRKSLTAYPEHLQKMKKYRWDIRSI